MAEWDIRDAEIASLRGTIHDELDCTRMLLLCGELGGMQPGEAPAKYLRRLIDRVIELEKENKMLEGEVDAVAHGF